MYHACAMRIVLRVAIAIIIYNVMYFNINVINDLHESESLHNNDTS